VDHVSAAWRTRVRGVLVLALSLALLLLPSALSAPPELTLLGRAFALRSPDGLRALALLPLVWWSARASLASLSPGRRHASLALRCAGLVGLAVALAQPVEHVASARSSTVVVVDVSDSMDDASLARAGRYLARLQPQRSAERQLELVTFAARPLRQPLPSLPARQAGTGQTGAPPVALARHADGRASELERALSLALGLLDPTAVPQIVLFSDGRETAGDLLRAADALARRGVPLWYAAPTSFPAELGIVGLELPRVVRVGEPFAVEARLSASSAQPVRLRLLQNGELDGPSAARSLRLEAGETRLAFRSLVRRPGTVHYTLELTPEGEDRFAENNRFEQSAVVQGPPRVLLVEREPAQAYALLDLLRAAGFEVTLKTPDAAPRGARELEPYDFYVLSDVPAPSLTHDSQEAIVQYVAHGGGFLMAGGDHAFGLGGYQGSRIEPLLPLTLEGTAERAEASLALVLAIDKSGSMAGDKLERAKQAAVATAELLRPDSYLGVIGFDAAPVRVVRLSLASQQATLARDIGTLSAAGGTALFPALDAAYADLAGVQARLKHVVLLTDGQTEEESLDALAASMRADGITVSTVGLGEDVNRGLLSQLAASAGGRSYFTRDPARVPRLFAQEAELLSRSAAVETRVRVLRASPADFLRGIALESAPPLRGYVATRPRAAPAELLLQTARGEPILARMRVGLGWSLALTTDAKPRWSADWFRWRGLSVLYAQLVREHMRRDDRENLPIETRFEGDTLIASIDVLSEHTRFVDGLAGTLQVQNDRGFAAAVPLIASAPGRYEGRVPLTALGSYTLRARLDPVLAPAGTGDPPAPSRQAQDSVSLPFPAEYRPPFAAGASAHEALLGSAAARTGGGVLPPPDRLLAAQGRVSERHEERWQAVLWCVLLLFLLDLAARRAPLPSRRARQGA
jgi:Ca-activated chloride channel homolog